MVVDHLGVAFIDTSLSTEMPQVTYIKPFLVNLTLQEGIWLAPGLCYITASVSVEIPDPVQFGNFYRKVPQNLPLHLRLIRFHS